MEEAYRTSLFKSFTKTLEDGFFPVVIVDAIHDKVRLDVLPEQFGNTVCHYFTSNIVKNEVPDVKAVGTNMNFFKIYRLNILTSIGAMQNRKVLR